jgi:hypothetical protein
MLGVVVRGSACHLYLPRQAVFFSLYADYSSFDLYCPALGLSAHFRFEK